MRILSILFIVISFISLVSCDEKEPEFESGTPSHNASIRVYAYLWIDNKKVYKANVEIRLYKYSNDRKDDVSVVQTGKTDSEGHAGFYNLDDEKYYLRAIDPGNPNKLFYDEANTPRNTVTFVEFVLNP